MLLKISGVANLLKNKFTLRSWQGLSVDMTSRIISYKSSRGRFSTLSGMPLSAERKRESK